MKLSHATLGKLAEEYKGTVQTGPFGSQLHRSDYREQGTPTVMPQNIVSDRIVTEEIARIDDATLFRLSRHMLQVGDIIYPRRGDLNKRSLITEREAGWLCGTGCIKISLTESPVLSKYLFYYLKQPHVVQYIENKAVGATMLNLSASLLKTVEIQYPEEYEQQRIADILSAYDDLIDNNNRRIALLEESIHLLYKEWFVYLKFPGHDQVKAIDGVPNGWERLNIGQLLSFHIGGGWGKEEINEKYTEPGVVIRGTDIPKVLLGSWSELPFRYHQESNIRSRKLQDGDLIFEVSGGSKTQGVGRTLLIDNQLINSIDAPVICASFCKLLRPLNKDISLYLYCLLLRERASDGLMQYESQSASNIINFKFKEFVANKTVLKPKTSVLERFSEKILPCLNQIRTLGLQNQKLREARDRLLPRLMSGEIAV